MRPAGRAWTRFWFEPQPTSTLALVRIAFGLVMVGWCVSLAPVLFSVFGREGVLTAQPRTREAGRATWGLLGLFPSNAAVVALFAITLAASVCLVLGYRTRLAAVLVFLGVLSFERRNPWVFDSGDGLLRIIAFYLALAPAGASLSLDRLRRAREWFWESPLRAPWALRLMQVQLSIVYLATVWAKTRGTAWNDGTAVSFALRIKDLERLPVPHELTTSVLASNVMTYGTLAIELAIAILVWNRRARPWVLGAGVALHIGIAYSIKVGFFSLAMFVLYLAFLPPDTASRLIRAVHERLHLPRRQRTRQLSAT